MAPAERAAWSPGDLSPFERTQLRTAALYDRLATPERIHRIERLMITLAVVGFVLHLALIWLCALVPALAPLRPLVGINYLGALYTPFSAILFYELLLLVLTIPESTTLALGRQFEIISLIVIRNVFKDLAEFESLSNIEAQTGILQKVLLDMGGGVLLFLMVGAFYHVNRVRTPQDQARAAPGPDLALFIAQKKLVALCLSALFFTLLALSIVTWGTAVLASLSGEGLPPRSLTTIFYTDIFTVLVFADVLLLVLSLRLSDSYPLVFRNAGFVASTILLRISIGAAWPYSLLAAIAAVGFGLLINAVYKYGSRVTPGKAEG